VEIVSNIKNVSMTRIGAVQRERACTGTDPAWLEPEIVEECASDSGKSSFKPICQ
jgi:hypothetical protein